MIYCYKKIKQESSSIKQQILSRAPTSMNSRSLVWPAIWLLCIEVILTLVTLSKMMPNNQYRRELYRRRCRLSSNNKIQNRLLLSILKKNIKCLFNQENSKLQISNKNKCKLKFCQCLILPRNYGIQTVVFTLKKSIPLSTKSYLCLPR